MSTFQIKNTYVEPDNQWYHPLLASADLLKDDIFQPAVVAGMVGVLERLAQDKYLSFLKNYISQGRERFGRYFRYADICTVLYSVSTLLKPEAYLEIGVRTGRSMTMVSAQAPEAEMIGFDLWKQNYAGMENPGPDFVKQELRRLGHRGDIQFVSGDSHITLKEYFKKNPGKYFDIITVDGDHTESGAAEDIRDVLPFVKIGGIIVFDDISHPKLPHMLKVWEKEVKVREDFSTFEYTELGYGVAFGVRKY